MKKLLKIISILLGFLVLVFVIDYLSAKYIESKPFLAIKTENESYEKYRSLFYEVYYVKDEDGGVTKYFAKPNSKIDFKEANKKTEKNFKIEETPSEVYLQAIETFYEDEEYICIYNVIKSGLVNVRFDDGRVVNIKEVLEQKLVEIESLIEEGIPCRKKANETQE